MKILIIGSGGREHAIGKKISENKKVDKIYFAKGNGGTASLGENIDINPEDIEKLRDFAIKEKIDLTIVGTEVPLTLGIVDIFNKAGLKIFGADKAGAKLEGSKSFAKAFMKKYGIPTANYEVFEDEKEAVSYISSAKFPVVIKADGLAAGKGVIIAENFDVAKQAIKDIMVDKVFGEQGNKVVIEEFLQGKEVSLLCFTDSKTIVPMVSASDYKKAYDNDKGLNTGGMGCISPSPYYLDGSCDFIAKKTLEGIKKEGFDVRGIVYIGLIMTDDGAKVLEYNMRFGDPETEVLLIRLKTDLLDIIQSSLQQKLDEQEIKWYDKSAVTVIMAAQGYPGEPKKGSIIKINEYIDDTFVYHCGTKLEKGNYVANGGRVLAISALGEDIKQARQLCYKQIENIDFPNSFYRKDIGELK